MTYSTPLTTFLDAALASLWTTMMEIQDYEDAPPRVIDAFCELEVAFERVARARKMLR